MGETDCWRTKHSTDTHAPPHPHPHPPRGGDTLTISMVRAAARGDEVFNTCVRRPLTRPRVLLLWLTPGRAGVDSAAWVELS